MNLILTLVDKVLNNETSSLIVGRIRVMKKRTRNSQDKKDRIIESFVNLCRMKGYNNFHTNNIADHANISVGTIYRYFPKGKPDILIDSFETISNKIFNSNQVPEIQPDTIKQYIINTVENSLFHHRKDIEYHKALEQEMLRDSKKFDAFHEKVYEYNLKLVRNLRDKVGYFANIPEQKLVQNFILIFDTIETMIHRHVFFRPLLNSDSEFIKWLTKIVLTVIEGF